MKLPISEIERKEADRMNIREEEMKEFKKLKPVIDSCYQLFMNSELTHRDADSVIQWLRTLVDESSCQAKVKRPSSN
jgi:hypothetical protein